MRTKLHGPIRRRRGFEAGSAAVEFALLAFPLIVVALGAFDYFAATYETTTLAGAARAIAEMARNDPNCAGNTATSNCSADLYSLISAMGTSNNSLSNLTCCTTDTTTVVSSASNIASPVYYYSCVSPNSPQTTVPSCSGLADGRVIQYVTVTVKKGWWKLFSWDPWSSSLSSAPLRATIALRTQ